MAVPATIRPIPPDAIFDLVARYKKDPNPNKADLSIGAYRDATGKPILLKTVQEAERRVVAELAPREYLPIPGIMEFRQASVRLLFGEKAPLERIATVQTLSGTGAVRLAADFLARFCDAKNTSVFYSNPTWPNHPNIFRHAGFVKLGTYRYFDPRTRGVDFTGMMADIAHMPPRSVLILQVAAHNPTGADPTEAQWTQLAKLLATKRRDLAVVCDCAYQGYATGDLEKDAVPARVLMAHGVHLLTCQSYSKNMGLYGERVGCLSVICANGALKAAVQSHLDGLVRANYSSPPTHGAKIAMKILTTPELREQWKDELKQISGRISTMRARLREELEVTFKTPGTWEHITRQIGMFSYLGLTPQQCAALVKDHHIYLTKAARISVAGLHEGNVKYVAKCIDHVVRTIPATKVVKEPVKMVAPNAPPVSPPPLVGVSKL
eukprot:PhM_4_TR13156/c0_g1_i1/m.3696/K14455/GOT2; aspartate aminotransferase, mitochondrial